MKEFFRVFNGISNEMIFNPMSSFAARVARMKKLSSGETLRAVGTRNSPFEEDRVAKMQNESYIVRQRPRFKASKGKQCHLWLGCNTQEKTKKILSLKHMMSSILSNEGFYTENFQAGAA